MIGTATGLVFATAYLYYEWQISLTASTPQVRFFKWSDQTLYNTITLSYNVYADAWVKDDNSTHGIRNTGSTDKTTYVWFESITGASNVVNVTIFVLNQTGTQLCSITTDGSSNIGEAYAQSWNCDSDGTKTDTLKIWFKGASTVGAATINLGMKTLE